MARRAVLPKPAEGETKVVTVEGPPSVCCHMLDLVLSQEKESARTGLFRPLATFEHAPGNKLKQKNISKDVLYKPTGRAAQNFYLNFCPFCGERLQPKK